MGKAQDSRPRFPKGKIFLVVLVDILKEICEVNCPIAGIGNYAAAARQQVIQQYSLENFFF